MVDALRRARRWLKPDGCLIDLHPAQDVPVVEVLTADESFRVGDVVDASDAKGPEGRHHAADLALAVALERQWFTLVRRSVFTFVTEADTTDEIEEHLRLKWRAASIETETRDRARTLLRDHAGATVRIVERVAIASMTVVT